MSGLLLRVLSVCKFLQSIRFPSASFGRFLKPEIDERQTCIRSFTPSSSNLLLDGRLSGLRVGHAQLQWIFFGDMSHERNVLCDMNET